MSKREFIKKIVSDLKEYIRVLLKYEQTYETLEWDVIKNIDSYFDRLNNDIDSNVIPESFYNHLENDLTSFNVIDSFSNFVELTEKEISNLIGGFKQKLNYCISYDLYSKLNFARENIVLVGANGSGKTSLANVFKSTMHFENGIVIPAQKLLVFPTIENIPSYSYTLNEYDSYQQDVLDCKQTYVQRNSNDIPYNLVVKYSAELKNVVSILIAERNEIRNNFCDKKQHGEDPSNNELHCKLDDVMEIWNFLIEHRKLTCESTANLVIYDGDEKYPAYKMSDGERAIFYIVARVVFAPKNSLIVADEPEMYLHPTIVNKLWDKLEEKRNDCKFVYLTHNLKFAESRNALKCWIKSYHCNPTQIWDIEKIDFDSELPESMLLKIVGSRKKILFCEGNDNSLDKKIFEKVFENYSIIPVENCSSVIRYTKAFNKLPNQITKAYGLIDRDFLTEDALKNLENDNIYSYSVAEVENLFLIEYFIKAFEKYKHEEDVFDSIKIKVLEKLKEDAEIQAAKYTISKINFIFNGDNQIKGKSISEVTSSFERFCSNVNAQEIYNKRLEEIKNVCESQNYSQAILMYNNKGLKSIVEGILKMKDYHERALKFLTDEPDKCDLIKDVFPKQLVAG